jgi:hypothetical protein
MHTNEAGMESKGMYYGMLKHLNEVNLGPRKRGNAETQMRRAAAIVEAVLGLFVKAPEHKADAVAARH